MKLEGVAALLHASPGTDGSAATARDVAIRNLLKCFQENFQEGGGAYLAWQFDEHRKSISTEGKATKKDRERLAAIAQVVRTAEAKLQRITARYGDVDLDSALAVRALLAKHRELTGDFGDAPTAVVTRYRAFAGFLADAVPLVILSNDAAIRDVPIDEFTRLAAQLSEEVALPKKAAHLLRMQIASVRRFYGREEDRDVRFRRALDELLLVSQGAFRPLLERPAAPTLAKSATPQSISFKILPPGQMRMFLDDLKRGGSHRRPRVIDERRVAVLQNLRARYRTRSCALYTTSGTTSSHLLDTNEYVVLSIKRHDSLGEDAIAISPLAGEHAVFVVRQDRTGRKWRKVLASTKTQATELGARRLQFAAPPSGLDKYEAMLQRLIAVLDGPPEHFLHPLHFDRETRRYKVLSGPTQPRLSKNR